MLLLKTETLVARQRGEGDLGGGAHQAMRTGVLRGDVEDTAFDIKCIYTQACFFFFSSQSPRSTLSSFSWPSTLSVSATALNGPVFTHRHM